MNLFVNRNAESRIRQGVTLEVVGQDGGSIGPWSDAQFESNRDSWRRRGVEIDFRDPAGFVERISRESPAVNVASMVGNGALRGLVVGNEDRPATPAEIAEMQDILEDQLGAGMCRPFIRSRVHAEWLCRCGRTRRVGQCAGRDWAPVRIPHA